MADSLEVRELINEFKSQYPKSEIKDIEDRLSRYYSILVLRDCTSPIDTRIEYYNVVPDKKFKAIKKKILTISKKGLNEIIK